MSQLSFASFFDQSKEAAPATPVKPAWPAINAQPIPHRMMTIEEARRQFVSVFMDTARNLRRWEVFSDFITLAASELDIARIRTPVNIERSCEICAKYSASDIRNLHTLFCLMVCALEAKFHDFLGAIFMELELGDDRNGQYFTPYYLQSLMAKLLIPDVEQTIRREGFVTVSDPASGAAGMIVAYAENLLAAGYNPSEHMFGSCIDIDPIAADMAFIQLSLLGIPAEVVTGNTLTMQLNRVRYTPVYYINNFEKRLEDQCRISAMREFLRGINEAA
ncbi:SAM-dependent DNA methyltransferase [Salmonella enterica]|uniref:SAM-dependent DNA methyltransferase n=1 Tax=Salmonella newport TaxID=108619 RepID=A0A8E7D2G5_SALNE|nr:SAM-dependent DNA methyltransferase [Salmonella enterica]EFQ1244383.1 SAM-dependent DNA methyltransferase [Salmonella enterica subsp. enterica serovar Newport]EAO9906919.1 SAM-dependent DNA methyltransferase [Salmonella enterica]EAR8964795.1 SAM-dependent DNA methyltransferase [Salmonella enterica]EBN3599535.1 SAM-dependent DNA methyltransferase [Salmonella enterica]